MMRRHPHLVAWFLALAAALMLGACASKPKPTMLDINLEATATVNPDTRNRASPVTVRIYELKTPAAFNSADFFSLFEKDREVLAADMLARDEYILKPGDKMVFKREAKPETRYVAVLVAYRDLERSVWRSSSAIALNATQTVQVTADQRSVKLNAFAK